MLLDTIANYIPFYPQPVVRLTHYTKDSINETDPLKWDKIKNNVLSV